MLLYRLLLKIPENPSEAIEIKQLSQILSSNLDSRLLQISLIKVSIFSQKLRKSAFSIETSDFFLHDKKMRYSSDILSEKTVFFSNFSDIEEMKEIRLKLLLNDFLLIEGPASSGKSALLQHIFTNQEKILVYIDSTTDIKSLIGAYVSAEKIGEFEFRNGPLTQALLKGITLILENFQEANEEIIVMLIRLLEKNGLDLPNQQDFLKKKAGFRIIAVANFEVNHSAFKREMLINHVDFHQKNPLLFEKILNIAGFFYRKVCESPIYDKILRIQQIFKENYEKIVKKNSRYFQPNNVRKWLNLFKRLDFFMRKTYGNEGILNGNLTEDFRRIFLLEIIDIFFSNDPELKTSLFLEEIIIEIIVILQLESQIPSISSYFSQYSPQIELSSQNALIGRLGLFSREIFEKSSEISRAFSSNSSNSCNFSPNAINIVYNSYSSRLLEKIAVCVFLAEPCLLIGDTGCGKTTMVQHCAEIFQKKLWVYNMNPNSDAIDLIGGFKPLDIKVLLKQLLSKYIKRFEEIGNMKANAKFLNNLRELLMNKNYILLMQCLLESFAPIKVKIMKKFQDSAECEKMLKKWEKFERKIENFLKNKEKIDSNLAFHYVEGSLITALKNGDFLLIDEINLANNEVLQRILPILEGESLLLYDKGDIKTIKRHKDFRIFACMNPGKDIGKKELPDNIRAKFTEFFIEDITEKNDILVFIERQIGHLFTKEICDKIVELFIEFKGENEIRESGANKRLHVSLRNLARCLKYIVKNHHIYGLERTLYDALFLGFASSLSQNGQEDFQKTLQEKFAISPVQYQGMLKKPIITPKEFTNHSGVIFF